MYKYLIECEGCLHKYRTDYFKSKCPQCERINHPVKTNWLDSLGKNVWVVIVLALLFVLILGSPIWAYFSRRNKMSFWHSLGALGLGVLSLYLFYDMEDQGWRIIICVLNIFGVALSCYTLYEIRERSITASDQIDEDTSSLVGDAGEPIKSPAANEALKAVIKYRYHKRFLVGNPVAHLFLDGVKVAKHSLKKDFELDIPVTEEAHKIFVNHKSLTGDMDAELHLPEMHENHPKTVILKYDKTWGRLLLLDQDIQKDQTLIDRINAIPIYAKLAFVASILYLIISNM